MTTFSESIHRDSIGDHAAASGGGEELPPADHGAWAALHQPAQARSRSGSLSVVTTYQGLPLSVRIEPSMLDKEPSVLAGEILRLCRQAAMSAGVRLRADLLADGMAAELVDEMKLPKADDVARAEYQDDSDADEPVSWLRRG
ncbi:MULTISPECIES: hypothetical protein [unclassified Gordonia (in: high G+C Gram-positive bacteria)]|uniref:hypothetical protein n=1 Tax=unclassified Gordonia (in: high G+C Gram-positive bacteria) TaxID=2657482 RepID=UPI001F10AEFA|nr:hypothetical protein [Gordonia sp. ABSL49_1]MCH5642224.1 hypothetical protein [Gordonia sp. ABSL49_1]